MDNVLPSIILFDGVCNLCNTSVQFILKYEKSEKFKFAPLQSDIAQQLLNKYNSETITDSVLLIEKGNLYQKSDAALRIAKELKYFWIFYYLIFFPRIIRDGVYMWIAKHRYHWFGKQEICMVPSENLSSRFL